MARRGVEIDEVISSIGRSAKYRNLAPETIERVVRRTAAASVDDVRKRARRELHHVLASYHLTGFDPSRLDELTAAIETGASDDAVRAACAEILGRHATARERAALLDLGYYERLFEVTGQPSSIVDLAAALHPFELRWMGLDRAGVDYVAYDTNMAFVEAAGRYLEAEGVGRAEHADILVDPPSQPVDLAFFLMTYHCLEDQQSGSGWAVIEASPAAWTAVSVPVSGLGNRSRTRFAALAAALETRLVEAGRHYRVQEWETERLYLIRRR